MELDLTLVGDSDPGTDSPKALIPNNDRPGEEDRPFLPRFLLQKLSSRIVRSSVSLSLSKPAPPSKSSVQDRLDRGRDRVHPRNRRLSLVQCANIAVQESAPRRAGPCQHWTQSTDSAGSQNR